MVDDSEAESDLCIPYKEFASIMEQNKVLQETALHLREENHLLNEENRSLLDELEAGLLKTKNDSKKIEIFYFFRFFCLQWKFLFLTLGLNYRNMS